MMNKYNTNAGLVDQRIEGILSRNPDLFSDYGDLNRKKSAAFVALAASAFLDIPIESTKDILTDGGSDFGVDALYVGDVEDGEFQINIFQGKYKTKDFSGTANFPENGLKSAINAVSVLFDPKRPVSLNPKIAPPIEDIRSQIRDGYIPTVRVVLCGNCAKWTVEADEHIKDAVRDYGDKVEFLFINHDDIINIMQRGQRVDATLHLEGASIVEDMDFTRVMIGRMPVREIVPLFQQHGDRLLQRNIRRYLGLHNRVNEAIGNSLCDAEKAHNFYFYNNGITIICDKFDYNAFEKSDHIVKLKNMQIINGGQTCKTIAETLTQNVDAGRSAYVMVRIYQLSDEKENFVRDVTYATNSQNPVDLRDLHSNDEYQKQLEIGIIELGFTYKRYREAGLSGSDAVTSSTVAEAVFAVWRHEPHLARFRRAEHFGKFYDTIFKGLTAAQALTAVLIFRYVENERRRDQTEAYDFLPYASQYLSMLIGGYLTQELGITYEQITHTNFETIREVLNERLNVFYTMALKDLSHALNRLYGKRQISPQQLAATFRRSDLLDYF